METGVSLTKEDLKQIRELVRKETAASEERVYRRIKDNALGEVEERLVTVFGEKFGVIEARLGAIEETLADMGAAIGGIDGALTAFRAEVNARLGRLDP